MCGGGGNESTLASSAFQIDAFPKMCSQTNMCFSNHYQYNYEYIFSNAENSH